MLTLHTRDGSQVGNAVLYGAENRQYNAEQVEQTVLVFHVETDFGNHMTLTQSELDAMYTAGRKTDYKRWSADRGQLINHPKMRACVFSGVALDEAEILSRFDNLPIIPK